MNVERAGRAASLADPIARDNGRPNSWPIWPAIPGLRTGLAHAAPVVGQTVGPRILNPWRAADTYRSSCPALHPVNQASSDVGRRHRVHMDIGDHALRINLDEKTAHLSRAPRRRHLNPPGSLPDRPRHPRVRDVKPASDGSDRDAASLEPHPGLNAGGRVLAWTEHQRAGRDAVFASCRSDDGVGELVGGLTVVAGGGVEGFAQSAGDVPALPVGKREGLGEGLPVEIGGLHDTDLGQQSAHATMPPPRAFPRLTAPAKLLHNGARRPVGAIRDALAVPPGMRQDTPHANALRASARRLAMTTAWPRHQSCWSGPSSSQPAFVSAMRSAIHSWRRSFDQPSNGPSARVHCR